MRQKVAVGDLRIGMYVAELDRPWRGTPFLFQGFEIRSEEELNQLRAFCRHVFVETPEDISIKARSPRPPLATLSVTPATTAGSGGGRAELSDYTVLARFAPGHKHTPRYTDASSVEEELPRAKTLVHETRELVLGIMDDARLGRSLDIPRAKQAVSGMVDSVLANPDALLWFNELKKKDEYTAQHSLRVCVLALAFGRHLDMSVEELKILGIGALLHDIGKMKVPNEIINKPARLTDEEFEVIKTHVPRGVELLELTKGIPPAAIQVARCHHERFNGGGYAAGLKGETIGLFGEIGAIVDCYDAITSDRAYHDGMTAHEALGKMYEWRKTDFHPGLVEQFIQCMGIYPIGSVVELSTGAVGVVVAQNRVRRLKPHVVLVLGADGQPFTPPKIVDLTTEGEKDVEIRHCLPAGSHNINPTEYLPLAS